MALEGELDKILFKIMAPNSDDQVIKKFFNKDQCESGVQTDP